MKAITPIIGVIILILIVIALAASAYTFIFGIAEAPMSNIIKITPGSEKADSVIIQNLGREAIKPEDLSISVSGQVAAITNPQPIPPRQGVLIEFTSPVFGENLEVKINGPTNSVFYFTDITGAENSQNTVFLSGCGELNQPNTIYVLENDIVNDSTCFNITADNIVLDGAGYTISGDGDFFDYGVYATNRLNLTIKNLSITNFERGIDFISISNSLIENSNINLNLLGFRLHTSANNTIQNNVISFNGDVGMFISSSPNNTIQDNILNSNNLHGISVASASSGNLIKNNTLNLNSNSGIRIYSITGNQIINNTANSNVQYGIWLLTSSNNTIQDNNASLNEQYGIYLESSSDNSIQGNTAENNTNAGIRLLTSPNNNLTNNTANSNFGYGIYLLSSDSNNLSENTANTNTFNGITIFSSGNNNVQDTIMNFNGDYGAGVFFSSGNLFLRNTLDSNNDSGITISGSNNYLKDILINGSGLDAIGLFATGSNNNTFVNVTVSNTNPSSDDIRFNDPGINGTYFIDSYFEDYSLVGSGSTVFFKNSEFGEIRFIETITGSGNNLNNEVRISFNSAIVESTSNPGLNKSANITLYSLPTNFLDPRILRDGLECTANICHNFTSLNAGNVSFNVSSWTEYSIGEAGSQQILFIPPTPNNGASTTEDFVEINVSITDPDLLMCKFNWNGANYTLYNDSLVFMANFDRISSLGENDTFIVDVSRYGNDGSCSVANCPTWNPSGRFGGAFDFNGSGQYFETTANIDDTLGSGFTMSAWIYPNDTNSNGYIMSNYNGQDVERWGFQFRKNIDDIVIMLSHYVSSVHNYIGRQTTGNEISPDIWYHVVATWNGSLDSTGFKIYINAVQTDDANWENGVFDGLGQSPEPMRIGVAKLTAGLSSFFNGSIDEPMVWNRELSAPEIQELYYSNLHKYDTDKWILYINQSGLTPSAYAYQVFGANLSSSYSTEQRILTKI